MEIRRGGARRSKSHGLRKKNLARRRRTSRTRPRPTTFLKAPRSCALLVSPREGTHNPSGTHLLEICNYVMCSGGWNLDCLKETNVSRVFTRRNPVAGDVSAVVIRRVQVRGTLECVAERRGNSVEPMGRRDI